MRATVYDVALAAPVQDKTTSRPETVKLFNEEVERIRKDVK